MDFQDEMIIMMLQVEVCDVLQRLQRDVKQTFNKCFEKYQIAKEAERKQLASTINEDCLIQLHKNVLLTELEMYNKLNSLEQRRVRIISRYPKEILDQCIDDDTPDFWIYEDILENYGYSNQLTDQSFQFILDQLSWVENELYRSYMNDMIFYRRGFRDPSAMVTMCIFSIMLTTLVISIFRDHPTIHYVI